MGIIKKNKKGVSMAELLAAIVIIGISSTTITSMVITSYKGQLRAQQYVMANEMAKTYDAILARDIKLNKLTDESITWPTLSEKKYVVVGGFDETATTTNFINTGSILDTITGGSANSSIYKYLYSNNANDHFQLNNTVFNKSNVKLEIYMISAKLGYYKTRVTIKYSTNREVTYDETHYSDKTSN
ncbi:MAG: hypothetical protein K6E24_04070 [bacterium]|nr:hypothetical protein [bacterium]